jgi:uncharacterized membrane protein YesL
MRAWKTIVTSACEVLLSLILTYLYLIVHARYRIHCDLDLNGAVTNMTMVFIIFPFSLVLFFLSMFLLKRKARRKWGDQVWKSFGFVVTGLLIVWVMVSGLTYLAQITCDPPYLHNGS